jgi:polar amino acid transport system permease protein
MIPPFMNQSVIQLKNASLVSTIAVSDLLYQGTLITSATCRPLETYTAVAAIYLVILSPLTLGRRWPSACCSGRSDLNGAQLQAGDV